MLQKFEKILEDLEKAVEEHRDAVGVKEEPEIMICPWCLDEDVKAFIRYEANDGPIWYWIECDTCKGRGPVKNTHKGAIYSWNDTSIWKNRPDNLTLGCYMKREAKPGKELDKLVAEKVMGGADMCCFLCPICGSRHFGTSDGMRMCHGDCREEWLPEEALPNYSTDITDAWRVVEKLQELPPVYRVDSYEWFTVDAPDRTGDNRWVAGWRSHYDYEGDNYLIGQYGETAMEAICKAALERVSEIQNS